ncbi:MAG: hypothetical protein LBE76_06625 [Nitrososphaerota archaeon]|jgi:hypothetical protein|nr:hypothetical protein [Nitrososphaerota archaeon]
MEFIALVIKDIFGVVYAPHKTFKKIATNPKYLAIVIILALFVSLQIVYNYDYSLKVYYEQTVPPIGRLNGLDQLNHFVSANSTHWITTSDTSVNVNSQDYINQTFYGNNSLQFVHSSSKSLLASLEQFGYTADCGADGFTTLSMSIKQLSSVAPSTGVLTLYTANGTSNYFSLDITSMLTTNLGQWSNLTIPVGTSEWQSIGAPVWSEVTGMQLNLTYPESSNINILLQGVFFRGQYKTQIDAFGTGTLIGLVTYSIILQALAQWILLSIVAYILIKALKAPNVVWRNLFASIGFTLMALVIASLCYCLVSLTLPTVYYPYDLPYGVINYQALISATSPATQVAYESIAQETSTYITLNIVVNIVQYVLQGILITFAVKAISSIPAIKNPLSSDAETSAADTFETQNKIATSELSYIKSIIVAVITVILATFIMIFCQWLGIF